MLEAERTVATACCSDALFSTSMSMMAEARRPPVPIDTVHDERCWGQVAIADQESDDLWRRDAGMCGSVVAVRSSSCTSSTAKRNSSSSTSPDGARVARHIRTGVGS